MAPDVVVPGDEKPQGNVPLMIPPLASHLSAEPSQPQEANDAQPRAASHDDYSTPPTPVSPARRQIDDELDVGGGAGGGARRLGNNTRRNSNSSASSDSQDEWQHVNVTGNPQAARGNNDDNHDGVEGVEVFEEILVEDISSHRTRHNGRQANSNYSGGTTNNRRGMQASPTAPARAASTPDEWLKGTFFDPNSKKAKVERKKREEEEEQRRKEREAAEDAERAAAEARRAAAAARLEEERRRKQEAEARKAKKREKAQKRKEEEAAKAANRAHRSPPSSSSQQQHEGQQQSQEYDDTSNPPSPQCSTPESQNSPDVLMRANVEAAEAAAAAAQGAMRAGDMPKAARMAEKASRLAPSMFAHLPAEVNRHFGRDTNHDHHASSSSSNTDTNTGNDNDNDNEGDVDDLSADTYLMILTFETPDVAEEFLDTYDGLQYSELEPFVCRVARVAKVEYVNVDEATPSPTTPAEGETPAVVQPQQELPTCPVCLDRLDESVSGILTTSCNHTFHAFCLKGWMDIRCPVCRYCEMPSSEAKQHSSRCEVCGSSDSLWICLICGYVGCGRYTLAHSKSHWEESGHAYALEIETQRVWDYVGDEFVHRLVRSKTDGAVLEVPGVGAADNDGIAPATPAPRAGGGELPGSSAANKNSDLRSSKDGSLRSSLGGGKDGGAGEPSDIQRALMDSKMEAMHREYTELLTNQLTSQREFFEERLSEAAQTASAEREEAAALLAAMQRDLASSKAKHAAVVQQLSVAQAALARIQAELEEERALSVATRRSSVEASVALERERAERRSDAEAHASKVRELEEANRDLMLFLETRDAVADAGASGGDVMGVGEAPETEIDPSDRAAVMRARLQKKQKAKAGR
mmetsp:Transcript_8084/g.20861  ORF Transcript_8084/g.20861 Transcript_8084/m.20861 type:complete len:867 (-) Transcript_8084:109-2709(-)